MALNKEQILNSVISGLDSIPKPKEGKTIVTSKYMAEMKEAFKYARQVQFSYDIKEMREAYEVFDNYIKRVLANCG